MENYIKFFLKKFYLTFVSEISILKNCFFGILLIDPVDKSSIIVTLCPLSIK